MKLTKTVLEQIRGIIIPRKIDYDDKRYTKGWNDAVKEAKENYAKYLMDLSDRLEEVKS